MKTCPFCKLDVHEDAIKCQHCHSMLLASEPKGEKTDENRITYILDRDLIRFAKFTAAVLAVFLVVGAFLFGFKLETALEKVRSTQDDLKTAQEKIASAQRELDAAQAVTKKLKTEVELLLEEAKRYVGEISSQRTIAIDFVTSMKELTPQQQATKQATAGQALSNSPDNLLAKRWIRGSTIRIRFIGGETKSRDLVRAAAGEWSKYANLKFDFVDSGDAQVRVGFDKNNGSWSYLGTDAVAIPRDEPTMNIAIADRRTTLHEFGHVLGLIEEHLNPRANIQWNKELIIRELSAPPNHWSRANIESNVFNKYSLAGFPPYREFDPKSIMNMVIPAAWTGGLALGGADALSESDKSLAAKLYPK